VDFKIRRLTLDTGQRCKIQIWDTAGQERFRTITSSYYRDAHGVIVSYDITNKNTFEGVQKWINEAERYMNPRVKIMLLGNKTDLEAQRQVTLEEAQNWANEKRANAMEASAKTGENVEAAFLVLVKEIVSD